MISEYDLKNPVYVGDTDRDRECCETVGVPFIFVSYGFGSVPDAKYRADSLKDLPEIIPQVKENMQMI